MARTLARTIGYTYIDSGAMYRAVTLYALRNGLFFPDGSLDTAALEAALPDLSIDFRTNTSNGLSETLLCGESVETEIRSLVVSQHVSPVAAEPAVRHTLTAMQQHLGVQKGIVMDGRDIGTAVFPQAELKVFVTASPEVRARRRYDELRAKGQDVSFDDVLHNVRERDYIDTHRALNPLRPAPDALKLDNSHLTLKEQNEWLLCQFHRVAGDDCENLSPDKGATPQNHAH